MLDNDLAPNGDPIEIVGFSAVSVNEGTIVIDENELVYSPDVEFTGTDSFTYTISDGQLTDTATVTVTVERVNSGPLAVDDVATTTTENIPVSIAVLENDSDPDGDAIEIVDFSATTGNGGTIVRDNNGTPNDASDDSLLYTPANGFTGTDSFRYTISDGQDTSTATVTVTVESTGGSGSISGVKFFDADRDGIRDAGEEAVAGCTIFLDANNDGVLNNNEQSIVTGANGSYFFGNLPPGTYNVLKIEPAGFESTSVNPVIITLAADENRTGVIFGHTNVTTVTGTPDVPDRFLLTTELNLIEGFVDGEDVLTLPDSLTFSQLQIAQGTGNDSENTEIRLASSDQLIAMLVGVQASVITVADFVEAVDNQIIGNNNIASIVGTRETLNGGDGNETLIGNRGGDILLGGAGADVFLYNSLADSGADPDARSENGDIILDFSPAEDTIRLNFEVAPGRPVSIEDVEINNQNIRFGFAAIGLNTANTEPNFLTEQFIISLSGIATTTTSEELFDSIQFGPL